MDRSDYFGYFMSIRKWMRERETARERERVRNSEKPGFTIYRKQRRLIMFESLIRSILKLLATINC